jgi:deazaflavin-dependent oxidoreductase (nitroreductase family)
VPEDYNAPIITEFRANAGKVGGVFDGSTLLLLHTTGARSGQQRVNPLMYQDLGDGRYAVFASKGGADSNPDWYYNVLANPRLSAEVGTQSQDFTAREATGDERERIWTKQKLDRPQFAEYENTTTRKIPVIVLEPVD